MTPTATQALVRDLQPLAKTARFSSDAADRVAYSKDLWPRNVIAARMGQASPHPPGLVAWPESTADVSAIIAFAAARAISVVPFGAGSGVCNAIEPEPDSIVLDMKRMRKVHSVDHASLVCDAEVGIIGQHLEEKLDEHGFTLGHFPSSIYCSTLGGWIAGRSAGQCSGRYGKIEDMVLDAEFVDGTGAVRRCARDNDAVFPLLVGSEGTLGVVTRAKVRIAPKPTDRRFASFTFPSTRAGLETIREIYQSGARPAVARLYDAFDTMLAKRNRAKPPEPKEVVSTRSWKHMIKEQVMKGALDHAEWLNHLVEAVPERMFGGAMLILVWESAPEIADAELAMATEIASARQGKWTGEAPGRKWLENRHAVSYRQSTMFSMGAFVDTMEVASTWSRLWPMYEAVREALSKHVFVMAHFSHAYPDGGSIYFTFAGSAKNDSEALTKYDAAWRAALDAVSAAGGVLSHHHGVGRSKAQGMRREHGASLDALARIKATFDPANILNPGALGLSRAPASSTPLMSLEVPS